MLLALSDTLRSLRPEVYKLKRTPAPWIVPLAGAAAAIFAFLIFYFKVDVASRPDVNPWDYYFQMNFAIFSMLVLIPAVVLLTSSLAYTEHRARAWKYLYTLPLHRGGVYFAKLSVVLLLLVSAYLVFWVATLLSGHLLGALRPEYGFQNFASDLWPAGRLLVRSFLAALGITALQYALSVRWKNYLLPVGIGFLGTVAAPVLIGQTDLAYGIPYCYPVFLAQAMDGNESFQLAEQLYAGLSSVEWYSLGYFVLFVGTGYYLENGRNVA